MKPHVGPVGLPPVMDTEANERHGPLLGKLRAGTAAQQW